MSDKVFFIDPVTRVEGVSRVVIQVDERNEVKNVLYQVIELRGFEAFCKGRAVEELPRITSAICGVCSWSHHLASGKAVDSVLGREPPEVAVKLREFANYVQIIDSHLLHLCIMALPDFVLSNAPPKLRNIVGLMKSEPEVIKVILKSRRVIKSIEEVLGGKPVHAAFVVPGGVSKRLTKDELDELTKLVKDLMDQVSFIADFFNESVVNSDEFQGLLRDESYRVKSLYIGLVSPTGELEFYDGGLRIIDSEGREVFKFKASDYAKYIAEHSSDISYSKFPYPKWLGWRGFSEEYVFRAGPLARLNVSERVGTERANEEYKYMLEVLGPKPIHSTMAYHWARVIECLYCVERMQETLTDDVSLMEGDVVDVRGEPKEEGVGVVEAPRGTLIHHYEVDEELVTTNVNIITPTAINNAAINVELTKVVAKAWKCGELTDEVVNEIEKSIRAYDPCNSCATHTLNTDSDLRVLVINSSNRALEVLSGVVHE